MATTKLAEIIANACSNCGLSARSYSGRGMFGKTCLSVAGEEAEIREVLTDVICYLHNGDGDFEQQLRNLLRYKQDNAGPGIVVYWPNLPYVASSNDGEEE